MANVINDWEELRRSARQLENELDSKLHIFGQLIICQNDSHSMLPESVPLMSTNNGYSEDNSFEHQSCTILGLLRSLKDVIDRMESHCYSTCLQDQNTVILLIQRHGETFKDYVTEYNKMKNRYEDALARDKSFQDCAIPTSYAGQTIGTHLDIESRSIEHSTVLIEEQVNVAKRTRENLLNQRSNLESIQNKLATLSSKKFLFDFTFLIKCCF